MRKRGIPKKILEELNITKTEKIKPIEVTATVENHQVKLPVPAQIRLEIDFKKGQKLKVSYIKEKNILEYKLQK